MVFVSNLLNFILALILFRDLIARDLEFCASSRDLIARGKLIIVYRHGDEQKAPNFFFRVCKRRQIAPCARSFLPLAIQAPIAKTDI